MTLISITPFIFIKMISIFFKKMLNANTLTWPIEKNKKEKEKKKLMLK